MNNNSRVYTFYARKKSNKFFGFTWFTGVLGYKIVLNLLAIIINLFFLIKGVRLIFAVVIAFHVFIGVQLT